MTGIMHGVMLPSLSIGISITFSTWLLSGWDRRDWAATFGLCRETVGGVKSVCLHALRHSARRMGIDARSGRQVDLGEVSEMIDIVRLGLMAGLSFDAALGLYCDGRSGRLARRLELALFSWRSGLTSREDELLMAARDMGVQELEVFAVAVVQAIELGAPLAETLRGQGEEMRGAYRAEIEGRIERAPVKLLIPTGTLILPALLLSILGPLLAAGGMI